MSNEMTYEIVQTWAQDLSERVGADLDDLDIDGEGNVILEFTVNNSELEEAVFQNIDCSDEDLDVAKEAHELAQVIAEGTEDAIRENAEFLSWTLEVAEEEQVVLDSITVSVDIGELVLIIHRRQNASK